ncbi:glycogenin-1a isoform X2 [Amia ocellicauda]|uniref:glycogenin-1a isoform X2 n=1 Tax=Amia ocellicauda TaxID=2972642 RepID=UPI003463926C
MTDQAFVTLATNDIYGKGALVLGVSLRNHKTSRQLVVLITPQVSQSMRTVLQKVFDEVMQVDVLDSKDSAHLTLMQRPELGVTLTKLHCWTLTQYSKCIFMDADTLVLSNIDELFERKELSAAPDPGWPDCFNSGVFVFSPSNETYEKLIKFCTEKGSFDGGDQGILNSFFSNWATADISKHLPFIYNLSSIAIYSYLPAFKQYGANAKVVHFLGKVKPWNYSYDSKTKTVQGDFQESSTLHPNYLNMWWEIFSTSVIPLLTEQGVIKPSETGCKADEISEGVMHINLTPPPPPPPPITSEERKQKWEQGQADYMGEDSFDNIQKKLDSFLK